MAAKPHMTVRLAPSMLHGLQFIAERETVAPAELARTIISASVRDYLQRHGLQAQCQDAYMAWLRARGQSGQGAGPADDGGDIALAEDEVDPAEDPGKAEPVGPYGPTGDQMPLFGGEGAPARPLSSVINEADRLVERFSPKGGRKGRG